MKTKRILAKERNGTANLHFPIAFGKRNSPNVEYRNGTSVVCYAILWNTERIHKELCWPETTQLVQLSVGIQLVRQ